MDPKAPNPRNAAIVSLVALAVGAGTVLLFAGGGGEQYHGPATILVALGTFVIGLMVWVPAGRVLVLPVGAALLGFATGVAWASAWLYWRWVEPQTAPGSNPLYGYDSLVRDTISALLTPLRGVLIVAAMALSPPFGGRRGRWVAGAAAAAFVVMLVQPLPELYRTWKEYPQSYEWGFSLIILGILIVLGAPAVAAVVWRLRGRAWPGVRPEASAPNASPPT